jgi:hypothetical protein
MFWDSPSRSTSCALRALRLCSWPPCYLFVRRPEYRPILRRPRHPWLSSPTGLEVGHATAVGHLHHRGVQASPSPVEVQRFELTCRLSHLGLTQATLTQTVDVMTGALRGTRVYVAANGDELAFTFTGTAELRFTDPTDATVTFEAVQDLSGGSGRFAPADGTAEVADTTRLNLITGSGTGELTLDGALAY